MPLRLLSLLIICFWLGTVGWLCTVIWAPPESRMVEVDPREAYRAFFDWNDSTSMTLLENGKRRGQVNIAGGSGEDPDRGLFTNSLSVSGVLERISGGRKTREVNLFWRGALEFDEAMDLLAGDFSIRVPRQRITARLGIDGRERTYEVRVLSDGAELFSHEDALPDGRLPLGNLGTAGLAGMSGFPIDSFLPDADGEGKSAPEASSDTGLDLTPEARMGTFTLAGREIRAYLLTFRREGSPGAVRVYLSEAGEPLRIESDFGMEAVSEILVPLDAYETDDES